jgi:hypothetical protein
MSTPGAPPFEPAGRFEKRLLRVTKLETFGMLGDAKRG